MSGAAAEAIGAPAPAAPDAPGVSPPALGRLAARGVAWSLLATAGARLVSLVSLAVLARLLSPADFGLVAVALVYITYVETLGDLGTAAALIWWPGRREDAAQASFVTGVLSALAWVALTFALAPQVAAFFRMPAAEPLLRVLAWTFVLKALGNTHDALCQKELRFRARVIPELGSGLTRAGLAIALAASGFGAWSLAWGQLAGQAAWTALTWRVVEWRPRWRWPAGVLRPMLAYGRGIVAVNVLAAVVHHADLVVVGRLLGAGALGLYQVAYKLPETAITVLVWVTSRVLFPTFSRLRAEGGALGRGWLTAVRHVSLLTFPAAAALAVCATPAVRLVFGERWTPAGPILAGLAVAAGVRSAGTHAGDVLKAAGRPGLLAGLGVLKAVLLVPALLVAARGGPAAVAWTMAGVTTLTALLGVAVSARFAGVSAAAYAAAVAPGAAVAACVGAAAWLGLRIDAAPLPSALLLAFAAFGFAARVFAPAAAGAAWTALRGPAGPRRAGRLVAASGDRGIRRYLVGELSAPRTRVQRAARLLPEPLASGILLRAAEAPPPWPRAARAALAAHGGLLDALEEGRWIAAERTDGRLEDGAVVALFDRGAAAPQAALKLRPTAGASRPLQRERDVLRSLRARLPEALAATLPLPLAHAEADGWEALLLPWLPGRSAYFERHAALRPSRLARAHLEAAADWLAAVHSVTAAPARLDPAGIEALRGVQVPNAPAHGDYWARNILLRDGVVTAVLDWEQAGETRPVTDDLFHLALTYGLDAARGRVDPAEAFRHAFLEPSPVARAIAAATTRYTAAAGIDRRLLAPLFELHLATSAAHAGRAAVFLHGLRRARWSVFAG